MGIVSASEWSYLEVVTNMQIPSPLNKARLAFSSWSAKIEQAQQQRTPLDPIVMRRMEFQAVEAIIAAYNNAEIVS